VSRRATAPADRTPFVARPESQPEREADRVAASVADGMSVADWSFGALPTSAPALEQGPEGGTPLEPQARAYMEDRFGRDFGAVRMHDGPDGAAASRALEAEAFAVGDHIATSRPLSMRAQQDRHLLAHELAHVAQGPGPPPAALVSRQAAPSATPATPPPAKPAREERLNVGRRHGHRFDAFYNRAEGFLMARVKVQFAFKENDPLPWPSQGAKDTWRDRFLERVSQRWSFKHFLVPKARCEGEPARVAVAVNALPVAADPHYKLNVSYTSDDRQSSVSWGAHTAALDSQDNDERPDMPQTPNEHEFGHMLGLEHIHCDTNDDDCYGTSRAERADVMGEGRYVSPRDYEVFAEVMPAFTGCDWRVEQATPPPTDSAVGLGAFIGGGLLGIAGAAIGAAVAGPLGAFIGGAIGLLAGAGLGALLGSTRVPR
jgi:hypothetical protein